ncbi:DUF6470 family protein [Paenibacillus sp. OV219]|uniref:DUF6470 family protein n=1 Tax=Paenibacillus sp. OV219 TaxID=1884377 RepID=UPI0008D7003F|nr:DUF6470 family protein [Paenibacillus sp. OV219]SEN64685.1 hypothetical protein SAMN05518847_103396 [Paenibacillus sp. OV219]
MKLPYIQAQSQKGLIGIDSRMGQYDIQSKSADIEVHTTPTSISAPTPMPELYMNQDRMWAAFNGGKPEAFINRIYSQMPSIAQQGIAKIVEKGNQMGDLRIKQNPFPDMAFREISQGPPQVQVFGAATAHNVDIEFKINRPDVKVNVGSVDIQVQTHKPEINYQRGDVSVYMKQYPSVNFSVAEMDVRV